MILVELGFYMKHLIIGMYDIKALRHKSILAFELRNFIANKVIIVMLNIKFGKKVNLFTFVKLGSRSRWLYLLFTL